MSSFDSLLMGAHECSQQVMSAELFHQTINKKIQVLKWLPCSILTISCSLVNWITKWIFSESTRKGLLKNVKDRISRPLGSREIQITKVCTVLPDTLYIPHVRHLDVVLISSPWVFVSHICCKYAWYLDVLINIHFSCSTFLNQALSKKFLFSNVAKTRLDIFTC